MTDPNSEASGRASESSSNAPPGYERLNLVGRGGTSSVFSASRTADSRHVAIKVFDSADSAAFRRQRGAAATLAHTDGVLEVLDEALLDDGRPCLVFPFAGGGSLAERMDRFGTTDPVSVAQTGAAVARALGGAHAAGVLHRDVKPSNVLIDDQGRPQLADFGAATSVDATSVSETMAVTIMYCAPEVLEDGVSDARSDIYSLGLTLIALAIGRHPMGGDGDPALVPLIRRICTDGAPDPGELGLPDGLAAVLRRATALDPADRYGSAERFASALDAVAAAPAEAPADSTRHRRRVATHRPRWVVPVAGAAILVVAAAVFYALASSAATGDGSASLEGPGEPVTEGNGILGPMYEQSYANYVGMLDPGCADGQHLVELSTHAGPADFQSGVETPWDAVSGDGAGTWISYMPCDTGIDEARYILGATGRWFVFVAEFDDELYQLMSKQMRNNENSPSPDFTVNDDITAALADPDAYVGWAIIDQESQ